ncbi:MAG: hypothetical protein WC070_01185 [Candidatus Magasanikbacteria bacterium]
MGSILAKGAILFSITLLITGCNVDVGSKLNTETKENLDSTVVENQDSIKEDTKKESNIVETGEDKVSSDVEEESKIEEANKEEKTSATPTKTSQTVQVVIKDKQGNELYNDFSVAFEEKETGKQIRKFPTGKMLVFSNVPVGEYNLIVHPVVRDSYTETIYKYQKMDISILGDSNEDVRTIVITAEDKPEEQTESSSTSQESQASDNTNDVAPSVATKTSQTFQIIIKDSQGNEIYDRFTVAFEEKSTGKQIRKFPTGSMLIFSKVPAGEYNLLISPVLKVGETETIYKSQKMDVSVPGDSNEDVRTLVAMAEVK